MPVTEPSFVGAVDAALAACGVAEVEATRFVQLPVDAWRHAAVARGEVVLHVGAMAVENAGRALRSIRLQLGDLAGVRRNAFGRVPDAAAALRDRYGELGATVICENAGVDRVWLRARSIAPNVRWVVGAKGSAAISPPKAEDDATPELQAFIDAIETPSPRGEAVRVLRLLPDGLPLALFGGLELEDVAIDADLVAKLRTPHPGGDDLWRLHPDAKSSAQVFLSVQGRAAFRTIVERFANSLGGRPLSDVVRWSPVIEFVLSQSGLDAGVRVTLTLAYAGTLEAILGPWPARYVLDEGLQACRPPGPRVALLAAAIDLVRRNGLDGDAKLIDDLLHVARSSGITPPGGFAKWDAVSARVGRESNDMPRVAAAIKRLETAVIDGRDPAAPTALAEAKAWALSLEERREEAVAAWEAVLARSDGHADAYTAVYARIQLAHALLDKDPHLAGALYAWVADAAHGAHVHLRTNAQMGRAWVAAELGQRSSMGLLKPLTDGPYAHGAWLLQHASLFSLDGGDYAFAGRAVRVLRAKVPENRYLPVLEAAVAFPPDRRKVQEELAKLATDAYAQRVARLIRRVLARAAVTDDNRPPLD